MSDAGIVTPLITVVDDDADVRLALHDLFESLNLEVLSYGCSSEFVSASLPDRPGCLILDVCMPHLDGLEVQALLKARGTDVPIVFLSAYGDVPTSVRAMKAGAVNFLIKPVHEDTMRQAVDTAIQTDYKRRNSRATLDVLFTRFYSLKKREQEVMFLATRGLLNKLIAAELGIAEITVKLNRASLMRKMGAECFADLVRMADALTANQHGDDERIVYTALPERRRRP